MMSFVLTAFSGWLAVIGFGTATAVPLLLRAAGAKGPLVWRTMRLHYVLGFTVLALALVHAALPMSAGRMQGYNQVGIVLAMIALILMAVQIFLGLGLRQATGTRKALRRSHFAVMAALLLGVAAHIALNQA